jgi:hypothetical protein
VLQDLGPQVAFRAGAQHHWPANRSTVDAQPVTGLDQRRQRPVWRRDGRELFFFNGREIVAAEIRVMADRIGSGPIRPLFPFAMLEGIAAPYDVSLDGRRFLALVPAPARGDAGFTVLTNWQTTLNVR